MRVRLESIGCRLNIAEMEALARRFAAAGHRIVGPGDATDLCVFNTCAVTHVASRKSRKLLRQLRRRHPRAHLVATGCYAQLSREDVEALGVDLVVSNMNKDRLPQLLADRGVLVEGEPLVDATEQGVGDVGRTRAFVKVQDGCDNRCTFCIVTVARGDSRSVTPRKVIDQVRELTATGYREVVLSGVHLGAYGRDLDPATDLRTLIRRLLDETPVPRLRLSSLEPWDLSAEFFAQWQSPRLLPHLHLPLQSGSDTVLQRMARRTDKRSFRRLVDAARTSIAGVSISTDVMVGFPGESAAEFEESRAFIEEIGFSRLHVFRYSPRPGTMAQALGQQPADDTTRERSRRMHELGARLESDYRRQHVGNTVDVLWETGEPFDAAVRWNGLTGNYLRVVTDTDAGVDLANQITATKLLGTMPGAVYGTTAAGRQGCRSGTSTG